MKQINKNKAFTLVELIVVITILAILGTIAFISLQGYSAQARDTTRVSDIQNIKKSLELFSLNTGKYPLPDSGTGVLYATELVWTQGTVGNTVSTNLSRNLNEKPTDPLTETEYTYSIIGSQTKYELLSIYESDLVSYNNLLNTTNAANLAYPKISGNYNGIFVKTPTYYIPLPSIITSETLPLDFEADPLKIKSQIITGGANNIASGQEPAKINGLPNFTLQVFSGTLDITKGEDDNGAKADLADKLILAYSGTLLANEGIYKQIIDSTDLISLIDDVVLSSSTYTSTSGGDDIPPISTPLITQDECEIDAGWYWVDGTLDTMGDGFCISPRIEGGTEHISWSDIGTYYSWGRESLSADYTVPDPMTLASAYADNRYGVTYDLGNYTCKEIGNISVTKGYTTINDTIVGRMKYLADNKTHDTNLDQVNIDWVEVPDIPLNFTIPSIMLSDCIDGERDLSNSNIYEEVTFAEYSTPAANDEVTRIKMNNYLLGWAKDSGSHLPSAYSDILSEKLNNLTTNKGEYQIACDADKFGSTSGTTGNETGSEDDISGDFILLSAVGDNNGAYWGKNARMVGYRGCGEQASTDASNRSSTLSARFVVRP